MRNVLDVIQEAKAGELDEWSEIDAYEESMIENTTGISWVQQCRFSKYSSINYCYGTLVNRIRAYNEKLKDFLALGIYANDAWRDSLCKLAKNILGIIMYILWFDYGIETTAEECCSSDEIEIDIALSSYCDAKGIDKLSFIEELIEYRAEYKYSFSIFEDYPELEESFISMMGPYLGGVDDSKLTVEQVQSVCSGKKTPEELVNEFLFEHERLMLVVHHHVLERRHLLEHHGNFRALVLPHDVLLHAGAELFRLADVYYLP